MSMADEAREMTRVEAGGWVLDCDVEATRRAYAQMESGDCDRYTCLPCRNFVAARALAYPEAALRLYERLGIRPDREADASELGPSDAGGRLYYGWHHFVGRVVHDPGTVVAFDGGFSLSFHESRFRAHPTFGGHPLVQMEFVASIPWLLTEPLEPDHPVP
jgi:hypothetical protein